MKRGEKICVGSMVVLIISGTLGAGFGIVIATGGFAPSYIMEFLSWIFILSLIPIIGFICSRLLDDTSAAEREALRQIRYESPRVIMPESFEESKEEVTDSESLKGE
ncbi:MAG: hypothetical protein ACFFF9_09425 [Candidatus Thorarchaeota archaeon]